MCVRERGGGISQWERERERELLARLPGII